MDPFELVKFGLITLVPASLIYTRRHSQALTWLAVVVPIDALCASAIVRVSTLSAFGMAALPFVVWELKRRARRLTKVELLVLASWAFMVLWMVVYGFLFPWPDTTGERPPSEQSMGRSVIYTSRYTFDLCALLYIGYAVHRLGRPNRMMRILLIGTLIICAGVFAQLVTGIDLFYKLSAYDARDLTELGRARGFSYEPRGAAQWCVIGMLLCFALGRLGRARWPLVGVHLAAMGATFSTSGLALLAACTVTMGLFVARARRVVLASAVLGGVAFAAIGAVPAVQGFVDKYSALVEARWSLEGSDPVSNDWFEQVRSHLEVFDYVAVGFWRDHPEYLLFGTGPGTIHLPDTEYATRNHLRLYSGRIHSPPTTGLLHIISNTGLFGLWLWLALVAKCAGALRRLAAKSSDPDWREAYVFLVVFSVYYMMQFREVWFLPAGIGMGACMIVQGGGERTAAAVTEPEGEDH